jgi:hypothetical protein
VVEVDLADVERRELADHGAPPPVDGARPVTTPALGADSSKASRRARGRSAASPSRRTQPTVVLGEPRVGFGWPTCAGFVAVNGHDVAGDGIRQKTIESLSTGHAARGCSTRADASDAEISTRNGVMSPRKFDARG